MHEGLSLLADAQPSTAEWIVSRGRTLPVAAGTVLVREGDEASHVMIVLDGLFGVRLHPNSAPAVRLGPGELIGEISFLERLPASATVVALEDSVVLALEFGELDRHVAEDPVFAADVYRALGRVVARRLRTRSAPLAGPAGGEVRKDGDGLDQIPEYRILATQLSAFKESLRIADQSTAHGARTIGDEVLSRLETDFNTLVDGLTSFFDRLPGHEARRRAADVVARELAPYIYLTKLAHRMFAKPRGYAGDFLTIDWMYRNDIGGVPPLGPAIDGLFNKRPASQAVRNRRALMKREIYRVLGVAAPARISSLACGPAEELFDVFADSPDADIVATLIDIDFQALAFVSERRDRLGLRKKIRLAHANLVYLATGRETIEMSNQHLVYSIGLVDYLEDKLVIALLNWIHTRLADGGKVIIGNFHPANPDRALMDTVLDWKLIHRSERDMNTLFESSAFGRPCTNIQFEEQRVNLFAECVKD